MSEHNITVQGGSSVRLTTSGKYCDRDIVVTAEGSEGYTYEGYVSGQVPEMFFRDDKHLISFAPKSNNAIVIFTQAFRNCQFLKSVQFRNMLSVYDYAFAQCPALEYVKGTYIYVAQSAFEGCSALEQIDGIVRLLDMNLGVYNPADRCFANCRSLKSIQLRLEPSEMTYIYEYAFLNCESLTDVEFISVAEEVYGAIILSSAFSGCSKLYKIDIPECRSIYSEAFYGCTNLHAIILRSIDKVCELALDALNNTPMLTGVGHIYVATELFEDYRSAYEATINALVPGFFDVLFRKLEDYTVDGTITGDLDESKI